MEQRKQLMETNLSSIDMRGVRVVLKNYLDYTLTRNKSGSILCSLPDPFISIELFFFKERK